MNENLHNTSHHDDESEEVLVLDDELDVTDSQEEREEGGAKGDDWDEVRFYSLLYEADHRCGS